MKEILTDERIKQELNKVEHPEYKKDIISLGMLSKIERQEGNIVIVLITPNQDKRIQIGLEVQIRKSLSKLDESKKINVKFEFDQNFKVNQTQKKINAKNIIAIGSGKGGVGKSTITTNLAAALALEGKKVGILDSDIYGPSIGKMFGIEGKVSLQVEGNKIIPIEVDGIKIISFSFFIDDTQPIIWRGPMLGKAVEQFLYDVVWGELDYLLIDLPPGTGDVQLSLTQLIELSGAIVVTTPQTVALLDARRACSMFQQVKVPIIGIVENMSEFICPNCKTSHPIFSKEGGKKLSNSIETVILGNVPINMQIMESGEIGSPMEALKNLEIKKVFENIIKKMEIEIQKWN